jgi:hypothetical protein
VDGRTRSADGVERVLDKVVRGCSRHRGAFGLCGLVRNSSSSLLFSISWRQTVGQFARSCSRRNCGEHKEFPGTFFGGS